MDGTPLVFWEGRAHWNHIALEAEQYPDPSDFRTLKLKHKHYADRWAAPMGGIQRNITQCMHSLVCACIQCTN